ncbi:MAG: PEGA domain-containing protein, partial [Nitrospiria bacterium]
MKIINYHKSLPFAFLVLFSSGCATIMHGKTQSLTIESNPTKAVATIEGQTAETPGIFILKRERSYSVKLEKDGYEPATATVEKSMSWWLAGNIVFGGLIGLLVDFTTGAAYTLEPERVLVQLLPGKVAEKQPSRAESRAPPAAKSAERGAEPVVPISDVDSVTTAGRRRPHAHALVLGIEQYRQGLPRADFAVRDAKVMREYLTKALGYEEENVAVLLNERAAKSDVEKYV